MKKKMIADYKVKKLMTEELLANADLDGISGQDNYGHAQNDSGAESNEEDANAVMEQMMKQYSQQQKRRPPAIV